jgi:hypothetical protein
MRLNGKLTLSCATMAIAILLGGCGSAVDPFGPTVSVSLMVRTPAAASSTLYAKIGASSISLDAPEGSVNQTDARIRGTGYGVVPVRFTLLGNKGDTLASVSFTQRLEVGYRYGIGAVAGSNRFVSLCGVVSAVAPLRNSASDSLFVIATGIPDGAVC